MVFCRKLAEFLILNSGHDLNQEEMRILWTDKEHITLYYSNMNYIFRESKKYADFFISENKVILLTEYKEILIK